MPFEVRMPQFAETLTEGTIGKWLKTVGEPVKRDEPLVEIITDKVEVEMTSPVDGVLLEIAAQEGDVVPVGHLMALLDVVAVGPAVVGPTPTRTEEAAAPAGAALERLRVTPVVARLAAQYGVDLSRVPGTGMGGRVTKEDLLAYLESTKTAQEEEAAEIRAQPLPAAVSEVGPTAIITREETIVGPTDQVMSVTPIRRTIAHNMARSWSTIPHAWTMIEVDITSLVRWRERVKEDFRKREGVELTYLPFVIKATVEALKESPIMNSTWAEDQIILHQGIHIGVAVARDDGVIVPVLHDADQKSITGLAHVLSEIISKARSGALALSQVRGATFTVNNTGATGSVLSMPIIPEGQAAILTMESIVKRPVVVNEAIAIRSMMNMALSLDHRIIDGLMAGRFLQSIKGRLEAYGPDTSLS